MIIKERDSRVKDIAELSDLLSCNITNRQKFLIEREIDSIKKGESGEDDSAYYINFYYGDSDRWIVIHDLRIEFNGKVAQIDHILINRLFDVYVLESKNYRYGIRITTNGEFEAYYRKQYIGIPSPIEQNKRHIALLSELIKKNDLLPKRLSISIKPRFLSYILISPKAIIKRPNTKKFDSSNVIKADILKSVIDDNVDNINGKDALLSVAKWSSFSTIEEFARKLIGFHRPSIINWRKKFGIDETSNTVHKSINNKTKKTYFCARCKARISDKEAKFCWNNKSRFKGKAFCYKCQELF